MGACSVFEGFAYLQQEGLNDGTDRTPNEQ
jgi:hypothetical protein